MSGKLRHDDHRHWAGETLAISETIHFSLALRLFPHLRQGDSKMADWVLTSGQLPHRWGRVGAIGSRRISLLMREIRPGRIATR